MLVKYDSNLNICVYKRALSYIILFWTLVHAILQLFCQDCYVAAIEQYFVILYRLRIYRIAVRFLPSVAQFLCEMQLRYL